ncbi:MAG: phosphatidate cytidylyltransferase [Bacillota bacterium]
MLKTRVLTALFGIPVLIFFVYLGDYWFGLFILLITLIGLKEYNALMRRADWKPVEAAGYLFIPFLLFAVYRDSAPLLISLWILFFAVFSLFPVFFHTRVKYWESVLAFWGIIYTGGLAGFLLAIRLLPGGFYFVIFLLIVIWCNDIFAYLVGSRFGRMPLAPAVSPKKTLEGTGAGLLAGVLAGMAMAFLFPPGFMGIRAGMSLALLAGVTGALGDLSQSALKRSVGAKDSGDLLPGHGGILDRFDSLLFAAPFYYVYLRYMML